MCGSKYLAQPPWFNFPEWQRKRIKCAFILEVLQDADRSILLLVWRILSERKKKKACLTQSVPWHDMMEKMDEMDLV